MGGQAAGGSANRYRGNVCIHRRDQLDLIACCECLCATESGQEDETAALISPRRARLRFNGSLTAIAQLTRPAYCCSPGAAQRRQVVPWRARPVRFPNGEGIRTPASGSQGERLLIYADAKVRDFLKRLDVFENNGEAQQHDHSGHASVSYWLESSRRTRFSVRQ